GGSGLRLPACPPAGRLWLTVSQRLARPPSFGTSAFNSLAFRHTNHPSGGGRRWRRCWRNGRRWGRRWRCTERGSVACLGWPANAIMSARGRLMQVILDVPEDLAEHLAPGKITLSRAAIRALALEGVRSGKLTAAQARRLLGIKSRYEMDGFLKAHGVLLAVTMDDVRHDSETALAFSK